MQTLRETLPEMIRRLKLDPRKWYEMNGLSWPEDEEKQNEDSKASLESVKLRFEGKDEWRVI